MGKKETFCITTYIESIKFRERHQSKGLRVIRVYVIVYGGLTILTVRVLVLDGPKRDRPHAPRLSRWGVARTGELNFDGSANEIETDMGSDRKKRKTQVDFSSLTIWGIIE